MLAWFTSNSSESPIPPRLVFTSDIWPAIANPNRANSVQPTAFTAAFLAHMLRDVRLPSPPTVTENPAQRGNGDRDHPPTASDTQPANASSSSGTSVRPATTAKTPPSPTKISIPRSRSEYPLTTDSMDEMTPPRTVLHTSLTSPLSALSSLPSTRATSNVTPAHEPAETRHIVPTAFSFGALGRSETPSSMATISIQGSDASVAAAEDEMTPTRTEPMHVSLMSPLSALSSLSSTRATSMAASGPEAHVGGPGGSHAKDVQMTFDTVRDDASATGGLKTKTISESTPTRRPSSTVADGDEDLPSCLPTPPSETDTNIRVPSRVTRDHDPNLMLPTCPLARFPIPIIPTPPSLTPEPSSVGTGVRYGSLGVFSEPLSPLTPPLPSPSPAVGCALGEGAGGVSEARDITEERTDVDEGRRVGDGGDVDAPMDDARSSSRTEQAGVDASTLATNEKVPTVILPNDSASGEAPDTSRVPPMPDDDEFKTPRSSVSLHSTESLAHDPTSSTNDNANTNTNTNDMDTDTDMDMHDLPYPPHHDDYNLHFSSPPSRPSPTTTPSRYATPTPDEDEVWHALMLGGSGVSTPLSGGGMLLSLHPSREPSAPLSIDPSVLHAPPPPSLVDGAGVSLASLSRGDGSEGSLSSLTELEETDVDKNKDKESGGDGARPAVHTCKSRGDRSTAASNYTSTRRSEPYRAPFASRPGAPSVRAASEVTHSARGVGGPGASVDQLALLARREPLRIYLKVPGAMRGVKRKWGKDANEGEGEGEGQDEDEGEGVGGNVIPPDETSQVGQGNGVRRLLRFVT